jgi:hypothetical protein
MLNELLHYSRMAAGIIEAQRQSYPADPVAYLRGALENRESSFLTMAQRVIYSNPQNPFHRMLDIAGCAFGDLEAQVRRAGLESALSQLRSAGVYLTHDEWKGKTPIVRGGVAVAAAPEQFRNPLAKGWLTGQSSGSSGKPVRTSRSTAALVHGAMYQKLRAQAMQEAIGADKLVWIDVKPILPAPMGLNSVLRAHKIGAPVERWFTAASREHWHYRAMTRAMAGLGNLFGASAPYPEYLPQNDFNPAAEFIARRNAQGKICVAHGIASPMVRIAAAALEKGLDISGSVFICGGEALTPAKRAIFERAGVHPLSNYTISEIGNIGAACLEMTGSCVHWFEDAVAVVEVPRPGSRFKSLHFTTLAAHSPNMFINIEMDDDGAVEPAMCDCAFYRAGFRRRINHIASFGKMSPQGSTFHCTDLASVMEHELPQRLGGRPGDFQLIECEASNGQTQVRLLVSPRTGLSDPTRVRDAFLQVMRPRWSGAVATREWIHSEGIEVAFTEPLVTHTGKVHPVRLLASLPADQMEAASGR